MDGAGREARWVASWRNVAETLRAFEPTLDEIAAAAPRLADFYNDGYNRAMMSNTVAFTAADVIAHVREIQARGDRPFLLERDGVLVGDADFRHLSAEDAEFAILIGARVEQGRGLGARCATFLHAFAFRALGLARVFVSIIPENTPSQRLFLRLGYRPDDSLAARRFADGPSDLTFSLDRDDFERRFAGSLPEMHWEERAAARL